MAITQWLDPSKYPLLYWYVTDMNGHVCGVRDDCDWGGPCDWQAVCKCGWTGSVFTNASEPGARGHGSPIDALAELLDHVGFDAVAYETRYQQQTAEAMAKVRELATRPVDADVLVEIEALTEYVRKLMGEAQRLAQASQRRAQ